MKLPRWFPAVRRPWNPAYREAWDVMTHEERQWSFAADLAIFAVVFGVVWLCLS